ncbi:Hypothetical protein NTJ_13488 [Nesidiocoris tenuis]|uniref:IMP dehydrogenase/GMP reductase domain-containing protein n=1 Tax=Nesidiocoris tenuis TaxID=355587 RepID=A0ABN7B8H3_9HEMI|nr:Hypothetical protein NTJ_13488 [Nesidiocoris tenuis]
MSHVDSMPTLRKGERKKLCLESEDIDPVLPDNFLSDDSQRVTTYDISLQNAIYPPVVTVAMRSYTEHTLNASMLAMARAVFIGTDIHQRGRKDVRTIIFLTTLLRTLRA